MTKYEVFNTVRQATICAANLKDTKNPFEKLLYNNAIDTIRICAELDKTATVEAFASTFANDGSVYNRSFMVAINLVQECGLFHKAHKVDYVKHENTVFLCSGNGYLYTITEYPNGWGYAKKAVGEV